MHLICLLEMCLNTFERPSLSRSLRITHLSVAPWDCAAQRSLAEKGSREMKQTGEAGALGPSAEVEELPRGRHGTFQKRRRWHCSLHTRLSFMHWTYRQIK